MIFYADDILILLPTVNKLQELSNGMERELHALTMSSTKSCCLRIGVRCDLNFSIITNITGEVITDRQW